MFLPIKKGLGAIHVCTKAAVASLLKTILVNK